MANERRKPVTCWCGFGSRSHSSARHRAVSHRRFRRRGAARARRRPHLGFLVVANHGVPPRLVDDTFAVAAQFFARPEADKLALKVGKYNIGYLPFGGQVVRHSPVNKNTKPNFSESFYITRDRAPDPLACACELASSHQARSAGADHHEMR
jgi:isopenicillin N synthase-like dioxygenase